MYDDYKSAKDIEPKNKEIGKELARLENVIFRNLAGEEVKVEESVHLQGVEDQRSPINEKKMNCGSRIEGSKEEKSVEAIVDKPEAEAEATKDYLNGSHESFNKEDRDPIDVDNLKGSESRFCSNSVSPDSKVAFINRKNPSSCLRIAHAYIYKLRQGKELWLYQPHSLSMLKVRTFIPKEHIMMETPHKHSLREAVVSHSIPTSSVSLDDDINQNKSSLVNGNESACVHEEIEHVHPPHEVPLNKGEYQVRGHEVKDSSLPAPRKSIGQPSLELKSKLRRKSFSEAMAKALNHQKRRVRGRVQKQSKSLQPNYAYPIIKSSFHAGMKRKGGTCVNLFDHPRKKLNNSLCLFL